jgi:DMSO/TMAO reductase YedYZ molybdopterin-dependent catalytic subunit
MLHSMASTLLPLATVPDFVKSLHIDHAMDGEVMIAYEMNGEPLPLLNGYPLKTGSARMVCHLLGWDVERHTTLHRYF